MANQETRYAVMIEKTWPNGNMPNHERTRWEMRSARAEALEAAAQEVHDRRTWYTWVGVGLFVVALVLVAVTGCGPADEPAEVQPGTCVIMHEGGGFTTVPPPC
jgi:hypothetical protein